MTTQATTPPLFGIGIAGNFAGHLTQTGEAKALAHAIDDQKPQALFAFYVPESREPYLAVNPYSSDILTLPDDIDAKVQMEAEVGVVADIDYANGQVTSITPRSMCLVNDATHRNAKVTKLAQKKNWGKASKGVSQESWPLTGFTEQSGLNAYRFCAFHCQDQRWYLCCQDASLGDYSYFYQPLLAWLVDTINQQSDDGALHAIRAQLEQAGLPRQIVISLGASRYTAQGERHHLQPGDRLCALLYHEQQVDFQTIKQCIEREDFAQLTRDALVLHQRCVA